MYQERHTEHRKLRRFWHGHHWEIADEGSDNAIARLFADFRGRRKESGPDIRLVHNLVQEVHVKYMTYLSPLPMIRVPADTESIHGRAQATKRERYLYGCWGENEMSMVLNRMAWYLPLMGDCFLGIWPDLTRNMPRVIVRSPERAFPVQNSEGQLGMVLFSWEIPQSVAKRDYPKWSPRLAPTKKGKGSSADPNVEVLEYSDGKEYAMWIDGTKVKGVVHNYGFNLFEQVGFINVPDEPWNHGAVEQAVNLNLAEDLLRSILFDSVMQNVYPTLVLEDPYKFPETIEAGTGGVLAVNPGGKAYYMNPPTQALPAQMGILQDNERILKQATSMPDVNFGNVNASIITGKAINELQGAGTGSLVEMAQGVGIGTALAKWNAKAIVLAQRAFKDERMYLEGHYLESTFDLNPRSFAFKAKGSEIVGSPRNEVVFAPHLNQHEKLVMGLQALGGGLVSKQHVREQIGIPDSQAMEDQIMGERITEGVLAAIEQSLIAAGATPEAALSAEDQALAYTQGQTNFAPGAGPAPALPAQAGPPAQGGFPVGPLAPGAEGQAFAPALALPPGSPVPNPSPQVTTQPGITPGSIPLDEAVAAFQGLRNIAGRVFLIGEIVQTGSAADDIEVGLTNPADRQPITDQLPQYAGLLNFVPVEDEPGEPWIEVTPGAEPVMGGEEAALEIDDDDIEEEELA